MLCSVACTALILHLQHLPSTCPTPPPQVLFNLNELQQAVLQLADQAAAAFGRDLGAALDPRKLSASSVAAGGASGGAHHGPGGAKSLGGPLPGSTAKVQEVLWEKLGAALDLLQRG